MQMNHFLMAAGVIVLMASIITMLVTVDEMD